MQRVFTFRPSPAMVVALIALGVALGGVSYAAVTLPRNSVGSAQLKKNAVSASKVKDRSLTARDFKAGQLRAGAKGATGATGATGPKGDAGAAGAAGAAGTPATRLFAVVNGDGTQPAGTGSGVVSVTKTGAGAYTVKFNQAVFNCAWSATRIARNGGTQGGGPEVSVNSGTSEPADELRVSTQLESVVTDGNFSLVVFC